MKVLFVVIISTMILFSSLNLTGCGGSSTEIKAGNTTMGQELTDLQTAYDTGVITEDEFIKAKKKILKQ